MANGLLGKYSDDELSKMSLIEIMQLRDEIPSGLLGYQDAQNSLANYDRRAFAREQMTDALKNGDILGSASAATLPALSVVEQLWKARNKLQGKPMQSRSGPQVSSITNTIYGLGEGLNNGFQHGMKSIQGLLD